MTSFFTRFAAALFCLCLLSGCLPAMLVSGASLGVMTAHDRRTTGVQTDDETTEWKVAQQIPVAYQQSSHINFTSYNRKLLLTGEVEDEKARQAMKAAIVMDGLKGIFDELQIAPVSSLASRSKDSFITSQIKARLVDNKELSANHVKVVTEAQTVYLMGILNQKEANAAIHVARVVSGVNRVVNLLEIVSESETKRRDGPLEPKPATKKVPEQSIIEDINASPNDFSYRR